MCGTIITRIISLWWCEKRAFYFNLILGGVGVNGDCRSPDLTCILWRAFIKTGHCFLYCILYCILGYPPCEERRKENPRRVHEMSVFICIYCRFNKASQASHAAAIHQLIENNNYAINMSITSGCYGDTSGKNNEYRNDKKSQDQPL